jgi:hypothetical protein
MSEQNAVVSGGTPVNALLKEDIEKAVSELAPQLVQEAVTKEEERRFRQLKWIAAFIGVVGLSAFGAVANLMIESVVDAKAGNIREALELTRINSLALKLELSDSFTSEDKEQAMTLLTRIAALPDVKASRDVRFALGDILRSFTAAELTAEVDSLFKVYQDDILTTGLSSEILLRHYGQVLVGRVAAPTTDDFALRAFERLEAVAPGHNIREIALAYRILYETSTSPKPIGDRVKTLLTMSLDLPDSDDGEGPAGNPVANTRNQLAEEVESRRAAARTSHEIVHQDLSSGTQRSISVR